MTKLHSDFYIETHILRPNVPLRGRIETQADKDRHFVSIDDTPAVLSLMSEIDRNYILGGIYLQYGEEVLMDLDQWDSIDHLWALILSMIENFLENKVAKTDFPEGGAHLSMIAVDEDTLIFAFESRERNQWRLPTKKFIPVLLDHARHFFQRMKILFPDEPMYDDDLETVAQISDTVNDYSRNGWWPFLIKGCVHDPLQDRFQILKVGTCEILEHFCYLDDNSSIASIRAKGTPNVWRGFLYFECRNTPIFDFWYTYSLGNFCKEIVNALAAVIYEKKMGVVDIEEIKIVIAPKNIEQLEVTICQNGCEVQMKVSSKRFLRRILDVVARMLIVIGKKPLGQHSENAYEKEFQQICDMMAHARLLFSSK